VHVQLKLILSNAWDNSFRDASVDVKHKTPLSHLALAHNQVLDKKRHNTLGNRSEYLANIKLAHSPTIASIPES
jgi:hypothetical protein